MAMFGQLPDDFFKYKKSKTKPLDGSVPGVPYNKFRRHLTPPLGSGNERPAAYHHDLYMHGIPSEYRPNINAPSVAWDDYDAYEPLDVPHSQHISERRTNNFNAGNIQPGLISIPKDDLALTEQFLQTMGRRNSEGIASDRPANWMDDKNLEGFVDSSCIPDFKDLAVALTQLSKVFPQDHPDIVNLKNAMHQLSNDGQLSIIGKNPPELKNESSFNPLLEAEKIFDQQMQFFEKSLEFPIEQQNGISPALMPDGINSGELTLEEIVAHEDLFNNSSIQEMPGMDIMPENQDMALSQIEHAIDQLKEQPLLEQMESDPFQMQPDPFMAPQYMPNYMMPGQMPFGPMGSM